MRSKSPKGDTGKGSRVLEGKGAQLQKVSSVKKNPFNHTAHIITLCAFRYALNRSSYVVNEVVTWLIDHWNEFEPNTKKCLIRETEQALEMGHIYEQCDQEEWEKFLEFAYNKSQIK